MAGLKDSDLKRIEARIGAANALLREELLALIPLRPKGWKRAASILREFGPIASIITVILTLVVIAIGALYQSFAHVKEETQFRTHTDDRLQAIEKTVKSIDADILALRLKALVSGPADSQGQAEAKKVLGTAKEESISLPQTVVEQGGKKFIGVSKGNPNAWGVALDFIAYRSWLNTRNPETATGDYGNTFSTYYHQNLVHGRDPVKWSWGGPLTTDNSKQAKWDAIGYEDKRNTVTQPSWIIGTGGAESLDGQQLRRAILINVEVHFSGGPVILEDVTFINCTFVFDNVATSRELGERLLADSSVNFRSVG
jgi:hypothetical protein